MTTPVTNDTTDVGRGLLLGLLAMRNDLISREGLLAAVSAWTADKSRSFEDALGREGGLSADHAAALGPLAELHVAAHGGDPAQSLAALSHADGVADELRRVGDADVAATIPPADEATFLSDDDPDATRVAGGSEVEVALPAGVSRYRVLKPHAEGGLGKVSVAEDTELRREVALKEIKGRFADDPEARGRFLLEAEVTGGLEHPGVVPVYGLGADADGRPYYAMRFVRGDTLGESADAFQASGAGFGSVAFRKLLGRFVDVCQAVAYAHSRGVLHRDLKPGNVMLGKYGETLVVDWGLAKLAGRADPQSGERTLSLSSGSGSVETQAGRAVGTPAFMPPEQAAGRLEEVGPRSDVYSLGATLYYLLCGRPPAGGRDLAELLRRVEAGDLDPPRSVRGDVPAPLEAVCLKALSRRPGDRYGSCGELAEECERWLADEPVAAAAEPWVARARRWVRKHPTLVASAAAALLVGALGSAAFGSALAGKNAELTAANAAESEARAGAERARRSAEENERTARRQSELAFQTLSAVASDLQKAVADLPSGGAVRRRLLDTSLKTFEEVATPLLAQDRVGRREVYTMLDLSTTLLNFGGGLDGEEAPATRMAGRLASRALDRAADLRDANPRSPDNARTLTSARMRWADYLLRSGRSAEAVEAYQTSVDECETRASDGDASEEALRDLGAALVGAAEAKDRVGRVGEAVADLRAAAEVADRTAALGFGPAARELRTAVYTPLASALLRAGSTSEARRYAALAVDASGQAAEAAPTSATARVRLSLALDRLIDTASADGAAEEALRAAQRSAAIKESLVEEDPSNRRLQDGLALTLDRLGDLHARFEDYAAARSAFGRSAAIGERLVEDDPSDAAAKRAMLVSLTHQSGAVRRSEGAGAALRVLGRATEIARGLLGADPTDADARRALISCLSQSADVRIDEGEFAEAEPLIDEARRLAEAAADRVEDARAVRDLTLILEKAASIDEALGRSGAAEEALKRVIALRRNLSSADPSNAVAKLDVFRALDRSARFLIRNGRESEALAAHSEMVDLADEVAAAHRDEPWAARNRVAARFKLGEAYAAAGRREAAAEAFEEASTTASRLADAGTPGLDGWPAAARSEAEELRREVTALGGPEAIESRPAAERTALWLTLARVSAAEGAADQTVDAARRVVDSDDATPSQLYNAACFAGRVSDDGPPSEDGLAEKAADVAIRCLRRAVDAGWHDAEQMGSDPDLAAVRARPEFEELLRKAGEGDAGGEVEDATP